MLDLSLASPFRLVAHVGTVPWLGMHRLDSGRIPFLRLQ